MTGAWQLPREKRAVLLFVNVGDEPIDLGGVRLVEQTVNGDAQGISFTFASQPLAAGEHIVDSHSSAVRNLLLRRLAEYDIDVQLDTFVDRPPEPLARGWARPRCRDGGHRPGVGAGAGHLYPVSAELQSPSGTVVTLFRAPPDPLC